MKIRSLMIVIALGAVGVASAQVPGNPSVATPVIDQRQANQEKRIDQGIASGALTGREAARLEKREAKIEADKVAAKADGKVTPAERHKLMREENRASRAIRHEKHDRQTAVR